MKSWGKKRKKLPIWEQEVSSLKNINRIKIDFFNYLGPVSDKVPDN